MLVLAAILASTAPAVTSPRPDRVALTLYRAPGRARGRIQLDALNGFGLVTETRTMSLPAGEATLRFEGVADGIIPASAIVTGLPGGTIEKNRDARLLSPFNLLDGTLGREVTVRRIDRLTGKLREERATIIAAPNRGKGGVVMRTPEGIETWRCPGLPEGLRFDGVPPGLSAKPVLSLRTSSPRASRVTVTLTYLSSGFDWNASYVGRVSEKGDTLDLTAWATLANSNGEAFPDASVKIVAGRLQRRSDREIVAAAEKLALHCYPQGTTTSNLPVIQRYVPPPPAPRESSEIVVTGVRLRAPALSVSAPPAPPPPPPPEDLGDLKLYRIPEPVTVAPHAQKQVMLIAQPRVRFDKIYRFAFASWQTLRDQPAAIMLRMENVADAGLGIPRPAGTTAVYQARDGLPMLVGLGTLRDTAKGEKARFTVGESNQIIATQERIDQLSRRVSLSNANPFPVTVEVALGYPGESAFTSPSAPLERIDGIQTWRVTVPPHDTAALDYSTRG
jgi:hypothetical protein